MKPKDKSTELRRRTASKSPAKGKTRSKSPSRSRSKSPARTPAKTSSKAEKSFSKSETKVSSRRKSATSSSTRSPSPKKSVQKQEHVKTKSVKMFEPESTSRESSRIAVKMTRVMPESVSSERKVVKTKWESEVLSAKSKKMHRATELGTAIFLCLFTLFFMALVMASSLFCNLMSCDLNQLPTIPLTLTAFIDLESLLIVAGWIVLQALLAMVPVGFVTTGPALADGRKLQYRSNALFALITSAAILAGMYYMKLGVFEMLSKHFIQMTVVMLLAAILFGIISHVAARRLPPIHVSSRANTGFALSDALIGRYLTPRICSVDVKMFFMYNINLIGLMVVFAITFIEAYQREKVTAAMILLFSSVLLLSVMLIIPQGLFVHSMFTMHDGFGILFALDMLSAPVFNSVFIRYLLHHPQDLCYPELAAVVVFCVVGTFIMLRSTYVKTKFRLTPHDPCFAAYDIIPTISGKPLLASGLWGWCRHPNYFGFLLFIIGTCLTCGLTCPLSYVYVIWTLLMFMQRAHDDGVECERKHGSASWARYCQRVRSQLIPYIY